MDHRATPVVSLPTITPDALRQFVDLTADLAQWVRAYVESPQYASLPGNRVTLIAITFGLQEIADRLVSR